MLDEKPLGAEALQQRLTALSRWENEGGSGPPPPAAGKVAFDALKLTPNVRSHGGVTGNEALRTAGVADASTSRSPYRGHAR